jgi:hypothetical protein
MGFRTDTILILTLLRAIGTMRYIFTTLMFVRFSFEYQILFAIKLPSKPVRFSSGWNFYDRDYLVVLYSSSSVVMEVEHMLLIQACTTLTPYTTDSAFTVLLCCL